MEKPVARACAQQVTSCVLAVRACGKRERVRSAHKNQCAAAILAESLVVWFGLVLCVCCVCLDSLRCRCVLVRRSV